MKKIIAFLVMVMLSVSVPSLAQQSVDKPNYIVHTIKRGEDLASIAKKYGVTEQQIRDANPKFKFAYVSLKLNIPQQPSQPQQTSLSNQAPISQSAAQKQQVMERAPISGSQSKFALSGYDASVSYDDLIITDTKGRLIFEDHFNNNDGKWQLGKYWSIENGTLITKENCWNFLCTYSTYLGNDYNIQVKADRLHGRGGFMIAVNVKDDKNYNYVRLDEKFMMETYINGSNQPYHPYNIVKKGLESNLGNTIKVCVRNGEIMVCFLNERAAVAGINAEKYYSKLAKAGDPEANYVLGNLYEYGLQVKQNFSKASSYYRKAAESGYTPAYISYALRLKQGGIKSEAIEWLMKAINNGNAVASFELGKLYYEYKEYDNAAKYFAHAVELPNSIDEACRRILQKDQLIFYKKGDGYFTKYERNDFSKKYVDVIYALDYASYRINPSGTKNPFGESASKGHPLASKRLAEIGIDGSYESIKQHSTYLWTGQNKNIPQDKKKAVELWEKTKDQSFSKGMLVIAKGANLYSGAVEKKWYVCETPLTEQEAKNGNIEAAGVMFIRSNRDYLRNMVLAGKTRAAELMDILTSYANTDDVRFLLDNSTKTGYDKYGKDLKKVNSFYNKAYSIATKNKFEKFESNDQVYYLYMDKFYTQYPQYDKQNIREKVRRLNDFMLVADVATEEAPSVDKFWGQESRGFLEGLFGFRHATLRSKSIDYYDDRYSSAIKICQSKNQDPQFSNYYKRALPVLKRKYDQTKNNIATARSQYNSAKLKEHIDEVNSVEIDWERSERPSGGLCSVSFLSSRKTHSDNGVIRFKNAVETVTYNIIYDDDKIECYKIIWDPFRMEQTEFKSLGEMERAIIKAYRNKYL